MGDFSIFGSPTNTSYFFVNKCKFKKKRITAKFADVNQSIKKITKGGKICWLDKAEKILPDSPEHDDDYMIYVIHYIV